jgi:hypothetical protein
MTSYLRECPFFRFSGSRTRAVTAPALVLATAVAVMGGPLTVAVLPTPNGFASGTLSLNGINDSGQVVGYGSNGTTYQSFIITTSGSAVIPLPLNWNTAFAFAINNAGQVTGYGDNGVTGEQAFVGTTSASTPIPIPSGWSQSDGWSINDVGQVAGTVFNGASAQNQQSFIYSGSGSIVIPLPSGITGERANGINSFGQAAGFGTNSSTTQAFLIAASGSTAIPLPTGWTASDAVAINNSGEVAGDGCGPVCDQAFVGTTSGSTAIPFASGASFMQAFSISNEGVVVGESSVGGWVWDPSSGTQLLSGLVPTGWDISGAISISPDGELILATGSFDGGPSQFLELSQSTTPEPATCLLAGAGLLLLAFAQRWRASPETH